MCDILIDNLYFSYLTDPVISGLSLCVNGGELVAIVGENGSGKSTLLKLISGELKAGSGSIKILGKNISSMNSFKDIGYVPQIQNFNQVTFPITVLELVVLNLYEDFGLFKIPKKIHINRAKKVLEELDLTSYENFPFNELSGGLKQRTMIARALINDPKILILDEPTAGVDRDSKLKFLKLIEKLNRDKKITVIMVTHELEMIVDNIALKKIYKMEDGRLIDA